MNKDEFMTWVYATEEHMNSLDRIIEDRQLLKRMIVDHLSQFFNFSDFECNRDFSVITLKYDKDDTEIIKSENLSNLLMDWEIEPSLTSGGFEVIQIKVYPFGVPNDEGD